MVPPGATLIKRPIFAGHFARFSSKAVHKARLLLPQSSLAGRKSKIFLPIRLRSQTVLLLQVMQTESNGGAGKGVICDRVEGTCPA